MANVRKSSVINLADLQKALPSREPFSTADKMRVAMMRHGGAPAINKEGRSKGGVSCPKCGQAHQPGQMCSYMKSLIEFVKGNDWRDSSKGTFSPKGQGLNLPVKSHAGGRPPKITREALDNPANVANVPLGPSEKESPDVFWREAEEEWSGGPASKKIKPSTMPTEPGKKLVGGSPQMRPSGPTYPPSSLSVPPKMSTQTLPPVTAESKPKPIQPSFGDQFRQGYRAVRGLPLPSPQQAGSVGAQAYDPGAGFQTAVGALPQRLHGLLSSSPRSLSSQKPVTESPASVNDKAQHTQNLMRWASKPGMGPQPSVAPPQPSLSSSKNVSSMAFEPTQAATILPDKTSVTPSEHTEIMAGSNVGHKTRASGPPKNLPAYSETSRGVSQTSSSITPKTSLPTISSAPVPKAPSVSTTSLPTISTKFKGPKTDV